MPDVINSIRSATVTYPPRRQNPPSKYLALWIALPVVAALVGCGAIGSAFSDDNDKDATPRPIASVVATTTTTADADTAADATPTATPTAAPTPAERTTTAAATPATTTKTTRTTTTTKPPAGGGTTTKPPAQVYYRNCDEVRAAGAAPLYAGQPGYRTALDRDKDGVACEN